MEPQFTPEQWRKAWNHIQQNYPHNQDRLAFDLGYTSVRGYEKMKTKLINQSVMPTKPVQQRIVDFANKLASAA